MFFLFIGISLLVVGQRYGLIAVHNESNFEVDLSKTSFYLNDEYLGNADAQGVFVPNKKLKGMLEIVNPSSVTQNINFVEGLKKNETFDIRLKVKEGKKRTLPDKASINEMLAVCGDSLDTVIIPETTPTLDGDEKGYAKFLSERIVYPKSAIEKGKEGTVYIGFFVSYEGVPYCFHLLKGVPGASELDEEAMRVAKELPVLVPATNNGKPVKSLLILPVTFKLS